KPRQSRRHSHDNRGLPARSRPNPIKAVTSDDLAGATLAKLKNAKEKAGDQRTIIRRNAIQGTGFVSYQVRYVSKLSDRDVQNPNAGDALRQLCGNAEATQPQEILNKAIRTRQQVFLAHRPDLSKPKATPATSY